MFLLNVCSYRGAKRFDNLVLSLAAAAFSKGREEDAGKRRTSRTLGAGERRAASGFIAGSRL